ncbi:WD40 repeat domain-containing protein [Streptacidiphilus rugosus]|uniref:WD40 repeat domain-containing protein n=1 Tax=Streptacidiphilus rugosus TaxID=405783 RepID=UPI001E4B2C71|nr:hypothetical protein [Streptacidiphilus rugosus]
MIATLPLDSPRWHDLHGVAVDEVKEVLEAVAATIATGTGSEWREPWSRVLDGLLEQETLYSGAYAVLPHIVGAAAASPGHFADLWVDIGCMVTAGAADPLPADLEAGFKAARCSAGVAAARCFLGVGTPAAQCADLALACVALDGHHIGQALWRDLYPEEESVVLCCPGCESETEIPDFFVDPVHPPFEAPELPQTAQDHQGEPIWGEIAETLQEGALGAGWEPFMRLAHAVAAAGLPREMPGRAVLCLVAGMVAAKGTPDWAGRAWARTLMLLAGNFRCPQCAQIWSTADCLVEAPGGARPQEPLASASVPAARQPGTTGRTGRTDAPEKGLRWEGGALLAADGTSRGRVTVLSGSSSGPGEGVNALTVASLPGGPTFVAAAGDSGVVHVWDAAGGRLVHEAMTVQQNPVQSLTALGLSDGDVLLAAGYADGTVALWDAITGQQVCEPVANWLGAVNSMCTAMVPDGRTLLVTATPRGAVRVRDPRTGESVARLNPHGRAIEAITAVPIAAGHTLIAAADAQGDVHLWDPAVEDAWEPGAAVQLSKQAREDLRHRVTDVAAVPMSDRALLATGDRRGVIVLWDPATGTPVGESLPPDAPGSPLTAMAAVPLPGPLPGRRTVLATGSKAGRSLRVWEPATGLVQHLALDVAVTCLAAAGSELIVGHDRGVLSLSLDL